MQNDDENIIDENIIDENKIDFYYFTDPVCSHCWGFEPVLGRFKALYSPYLHVHTIMGGLLGSWLGLPDDIALHWRETGKDSRMPIDGSLWVDNPVRSSYPASRVFKVIQQNSDPMAVKFLRKARESLFVFNQNIGEDRVLIEIVNQLGMNGQEIVKESKLPQSQRLLDQDLDFTRNLGVRVFPTVCMVNRDKKGVRIAGVRPFDHYVDELNRILNGKEEINPGAPPKLSELLGSGSRLFAREIEEMYGLKQTEVQAFIRDNVSPSDYEIKMISGELYIEKLRIRILNKQ